MRSPWSEVVYADARWLFLEWSYDKYLEMVSPSERDEELLYRRILSLLKYGDFENARRELIQMHAKHTNALGKDILQVLILMRENERKIAEDTLIKTAFLEENMREKATKQMLYAYVSMHTGKWDDAFKVIEMSLQNDATAPFAKILRWIVQIKFWNYKKWVEYLTWKGISISKNNHLMQYYAWIWKYRTKDYDGAIELLTEVWRKYDDSLSMDAHWKLIDRSLAWHDLVISLFYQKRYEESLKTVHEVIEEFPELISLHVLKSRALTKMDNINLARETLEYAMKLDSKDWEVIIAMIDILWHIKWWAKYPWISKKKIISFQEEFKQFYWKQDLLLISKRRDKIWEYEEALQIIKYTTWKFPNYGPWRYVENTFLIKKLLLELRSIEYDKARKTEQLLLRKYWNSQQSIKTLALLRLKNGDEFFASRELSNLKHPISLQEAKVSLVIYSSLINAESLSLRNEYDEIIWRNNKFSDRYEYILTWWIAYRIGNYRVQKRMQKLLTEKRGAPDLLTEKELISLFEEIFWMTLDFRWQYVVLPSELKR